MGGVSCTACPSRRNSGFHTTSTRSPAGAKRQARAVTRQALCSQCSGGMPTSMLVPHPAPRRTAGSPAGRTDRRRRSVAALFLDTHPAGQRVPREVPRGPGEGAVLGADRDVDRREPLGGIPAGPFVLRVSGRTVCPTSVAYRSPRGHEPSSSPMGFNSLASLALSAAASSAGRRSASSPYWLRYPRRHGSSGRRDPHRRHCR